MLPRIKDSDIQNGALLKSKPPRQISRVRNNYLDIKDKQDGSSSTDKIRIPISLVKHRKNKSNDYSNHPKPEFPSFNEVFARVLNNSVSPTKTRSCLKSDEGALHLHHLPSSLSPSKFAIAKKQPKQ